MEHKNSTEQTFLTIFDGANQEYSFGNDEIYGYEIEDEILPNTRRLSTASFLKKSLVSLLSKATQKQSNPKARKHMGTEKVVKSNSCYDRLVIPIHSPRKAYFDACFDMILLYNIVTTFYFLAFGTPNEVFLILDAASSCFFYIAFCLNFFQETYDERNRVVRKFSYITKKYLKSWFIIDFIPLVPLKMFGHPKYEYMLRLSRLFRVPKTLNFIEGSGFSRVFHSFSKLGEIYNLKIKIMGKLLQFILILLFILYGLACAWYAFSTKMSEWEYGKENFLESYGLLDSSIKTKLIISCYFMLTTLTKVGYGDYSPINAYEEAFMILVIIIGVSFFAYLMGEVNNLLVEYVSIKYEEDMMKQVFTWLEDFETLNKNIPKDLKIKIIKHFRYFSLHDKNKEMRKRYWETKKKEDLVSFNFPYMESLPKEMIHKIIEYIYADIFYYFQYFFGESELKYHLVFHFQPRFFVKDDEILKEGRKSYELYFILEGYVACGPIVKGEEHIVLSFKEGRTIIGDYNILYNAKSCTSYVAKEFLKVLALPRRPFLEILGGFFKDDRDRLEFLTSHRNAIIEELCNKRKEMLDLPSDYIEETPFQEIDKQLGKIKRQITRRNTINIDWYGIIEDKEDENLLEDLEAKDLLRRGEFQVDEYYTARKEKFKRFEQYFELESNEEDQFNNN